MSLPALHCRRPAVALIALALLWASLTPFWRAFGANVELISSALSAVGGSSTADGDSYLPLFSVDGSQLVFASTAYNLDPPSKRLNRTDLVLYRMADGQTTILTSPQNGGIGLPGESTAVGLDGDTLIFLSTAQDILSSGANGLQQLYAQSLSTGQRRLLSQNPKTGAPAARPVNLAVMAKQGRFVFFESSASDLVGRPFTNAPQIYRVDLANSDALKLVSVGADKFSPSQYPCRNPSPSADGNRVAYSTVGPNFTNSLVVRNLTNDTSTYAFGGKFSSSFQVVDFQLCDDGTVAGFRTPRQTLDNSTSGVFWVDLSAHAAYLCSALLSGTFAYDDMTFAPLALFPDGRTMAFEGFTNSQRNIWFWNSASQSAMGFDGLLATVPIQSTEPKNSFAPVISPAGEKVAFLSSADNVVPGITNGLHLYVRTLISGHTVLVDKNALGQPSGVESSLDMQFSPDGKFLAFATRSNGLVDHDLNGGADVFLYDLAADSLRLVSAAKPGLGSNAAAGAAFLQPHCASADGRFAVFSSAAPGLVTNDFNNGMDVFVADRQTHAISLVSVNTDGVSSSNAASFDAQITSDGRHVLFYSTATNLTSASAPLLRPNLFIRDLVAGSTSLVSPVSAGDPGTADAIVNPSMSDDGRYVLYEAKAGGHTTATAVLRDNMRGSSTSLGLVTVGSTRISPDSSIVALSSSGLAVLNVQSGQVTPIAGLPLCNSTQLSANGQTLAALGTDGAIYVVNLSSNKVESLPSPPTGPAAVSGWFMSRNGAYIAFSAAREFPPVKNQIYLYRPSDNSYSLVSTNYLGQPASGHCGNPTLSADGRYLVFASEAHDLTFDGGYGPVSIFVRDTETGVIALASNGPDGAAATGAATQAVITDDGSTVLFTSNAADQAIGATGRFSGLFAAALPALLPPQFGPRISVPTLSQSGVLLTWPTGPGFQYQLQYSDRLTGSPWIDLGPPAIGNGLPAQYLQSLTNQTQGYYAVRLAP